MRHDGRQLPGQARVDAEVLPTAAFGARIQAGRGPADDAEVLGVLQRDLLGHGQCHRGLGQFTVSRLATVRAEHRAGLGAQRARVHVPTCCRRCQQHGPGARAQFTVLREAVLDRVRPAGEVDAEQRVEVGRVARSVAAAHEAPVRIELLGQDHGQAGLHTLTEFQPVDRDGDLAVAGDLHEGRRLFEGLETRSGRGRAL